MAELCGFVVPGGALAYFFSGDLYWRFSIAANAVHPGCPVADRRSLAGAVRPGHRCRFTNAGAVVVAGVDATKLYYPAAL
jgi:hypothetical protein